jgi:SNF2 family DNA or RNA helicase
MLRRAKTHKINGKPILDLPARKLAVIPCEFDATERAFYEALDNKMTDEVDKLQRQDKINMTSILVILLRLRQGQYNNYVLVSSKALTPSLACNHPVLVTKDYKKDSDAIEPKDAKNIDDVDEDLANMFGALGVTRKCQVCQTEYVSSSVFPLA